MRYITLSFQHIRLFETMNIAISILFDSAYIEPALVTAHDILTRLIGVPKLYLIYLLGDNQEDQENIRIIQSFCDRFGNEAPIVPISLQNTLAKLNVYHFNNSIIYKALIPSIVHGEPFIMNLDAGILLGAQFEEFWRDINIRVERDVSDWIVGAHCHEPTELMPQDLQTHQHNKFYPAGNLLLFNVARYNRQKWHPRLLGNYLKFMSHLNYAEQELMCLTAENEEILPLPLMESRITPFLGLDVLLGKAEPIHFSCLDDCLFFKFVGSLKPWKYSVLDPNKFIYIKRRAELEARFPLSGIPVIERHRSAFQQEWALAFLKSYDVFLQERN
jgi:lipopolysaccharide biosynthesis glycosyltransferase